MVGKPDSLGFTRKTATPQPSTKSGTLPKASATGVTKETEKPYRSAGTTAGACLILLAIGLCALHPTFHTNIRSASFGIARYHIACFSDSIVLGMTSSSSIERWSSIDNR